MQNISGSLSSNAQTRKLQMQSLPPASTEGSTSKSGAEESAPSIFGEDRYTPSSQSGVQMAAMGEGGKIPIFQIGPKGNPILGPNGKFIPSAEAVRRNG